MKRKTKWLILLLLLISITAVGVGVWAFFFRPSDLPLPPDYAPTETEEHAQDISDDSQEKNQTDAGGGSVSLMYSDEVTIDLSDKNAKLMFANPSRSSHDVILQIVVRDELLAESGLLVTGTKVQVLELSEGAVEKLKVGGYDGKFLLYYYDPQTGQRAVVNTEIPVHIQVRE